MGNPIISPTAFTFSYAYCLPLTTHRSVLPEWQVPKGQECRTGQKDQDYRMDRMGQAHQMGRACRVVPGL